jgi:hypothetical protein
MNGGCLNEPKGLLRRFFGRVVLTRTIIKSVEKDEGIKNTVPIGNPEGVEFLITPCETRGNKYLTSSTLKEG